MKEITEHIQSLYSIDSEIDYCGLDPFLVSTAHQLLSDTAVHHSVPFSFVHDNIIEALKTKISPVETFHKVVSKILKYKLAVVRPDLKEELEKDVESVFSYSSEGYYMYEKGGKWVRDKGKYVFYGNLVDIQDRQYACLQILCKTFVHNGETREIPMKDNHLYVSFALLKKEDDCPCAG